MSLLFVLKLKLSAVLQKNPSAHTNSLVFQHFSVFEPFPTWLYDIEIHVITEDDEDSNTTITEDSITHWCSRRRNHALREPWKLLNRMTMCIFFLFCLNIIFTFRKKLQKIQKISYMFSRRINMLTLPWSSN